MRKAVFISVAGLLVAAGMVGGAWWWVKSHQDPEAVNSAGGTISLDGGSSDTAQSSDKTKIAVKGTTDMSKSEDFSQYEQYKTAQTALFADEKVGDGAVAQVGKVLTVNYRGFLTDGKVFDESYERGKPFSFTLGEHRVIAGWEQGLEGMKAGGKRRLIVPPAAGYGDKATGPIPASSVLVFDVELLEVK